MKSPTKTSLRAFSPADYEDVIGVNRASYPDYRESLAEWRHWDDTWDAKKYFKARLVAEDGGRVVGWGQLNHAPWAFVSDKYRVVQNREAFSWALDEVNARLRRIILRAFVDVRRLEHRLNRTSLRPSADQRAIGAFAKHQIQRANQTTNLNAQTG